MSARVFLGRSLIRLGRFIQSLAVAVLKPGQFVELSRGTYLSRSSVESWSRTVDQGLFPTEQALADRLAPRKGRLLLVGVGGGREAAVFAGMGFEVTGVDFSPAMAEKARDNLLGRGLRMELLVQDVGALDLPRDSFDVIWVSGGGTYSAVPTRGGRVELLKKIRAALRPGGAAVCLFCFSGGRPLLSRRAASFSRKAVALAVAGNVAYQMGDALSPEGVFCHFFQSEGEIRSELEEGGFEVVHLDAHEGCGSGVLLHALR